MLGTVIGKEVPVQQVDDTTYTGIERGGLPEFMILRLVANQADIREATLEVESNDLEKLLGRPSTPIDQALRQIVNEISQNLN